ncbi:hypothetical protein [Sphingomonas sp. CFBP 13733]|uniref:hypothetical protein n=1 Tax=Sphingomonas sp. CFBP 13733 TaxID=2775291 RepID=UPI001781210D|nr:hypothetical protein [Sphingomonas sp. CFBP 13733]MBD8640289.1 hypothetical protein [Sphingomonas sp. CFBP 13733]
MNRVDAQDALRIRVRSVVELCVQGHPFALDGARTSVEFRLASRRGFRWDLVVLRFEDGSIGGHSREVIMVDELESAVRDARVSLSDTSRCSGRGNAATRPSAAVVYGIRDDCRLSSKRRSVTRRHSLYGKLLDDTSIKPALDSREPVGDGRFEGHDGSADTANRVNRTTGAETLQTGKMRAFQAVVAAIVRYPRTPTVAIYGILDRDWAAEWGPMPSYRSMCRVRRLMVSGPASCRTTGREIVR